MKKSRLLGAVYAYICMLVVPFPAYSVLVNNGATTLDMDTGYEWLDVTETVNCSYSIMSTGGLCNGIDLSLWTFASLADVYQLWNDAGITIENSQIYSAPYTSEITEILDLVGVTAVQTSTYYGVNGLVNDTPGWIAQLFVEDGLSRDVYFDGSSVPLSPSVGGWFYQTTVVPIPPAAWLFGSGLLGLIGIAKRNKTA